MSCWHGEETFPCNQSSEYSLGCRKKFPLIEEEEEIATKDGAQIKKTKRTKTTTTTKDGVLARTTIITRTKDGVPEKTTTITTTKKDGVLTQTTTTTKDGVPEKTTTTTRKTTTTNDEAPIKDEVRAKTATKEQGRGDFLDSARFLLLTTGSFYFVYKGLHAISAFINRKNDSF